MNSRYLLINDGETHFSFSGEILIGRSTEADLRFADDESCSRRQLRLHFLKNGEVEAIPLSENAPTEVNGVEISGPTIIRNGDEIIFGAQKIIFVDGLTNQPRDALRSNEQSNVQPESYVLGGINQAEGDGVMSGSYDQLIQIRDGLTIGRSVQGADVELEHPTVSRRHARIDTTGAVTISDLGSTNGTYVNGRRISNSTALNAGDRVDIGPFALLFDGVDLKAKARKGAAALSAFGLGLDVKAAGKPLRILDNVSVEVSPREFVCIVGPSGSGKTTLMKILAGRSAPSTGMVGLNDLDLHANFQSVKQDMAMVPQHDVLHENLTLRNALGYTAMLRLPSDTSASARAKAIEDTAADVDLTHRLDTRIKNLSGGQKKRASLASETLSGPSLLFLDEVTSGLDQATDREIMRLLRHKADSGMTVVCVTHTLANVEEFCHKLIVMGEGGVLTFAGPPSDALKHFDVTRLGEIFDRLNEQPAAFWRSKIENPAPQTSPIQLRGHAEQAQGLNVQRKLDPIKMIRQFAILTRRNLDLLVADRRALTMAAVQSLLIGSLIGYAFIDFGTGQAAVASKNALLLLLGLCAIWLGCNSASQDIVGELPIFRRENDVNLSTSAFIASKFTISGLFTMLQLTVVFFLVAIFADDMPGEPAAQLALLLVGAVAGTSMGLLISSLANTNEQATTIVPLALVPQLILAGVLVPKLPEFATSIAKVGVSGFWLTEGMKANLIDAEGPIQVFDAVSNSFITMEAEPALLGAAIIALHCLAFLFLSYLFVILGTRQRR